MSRRDLALVAVALVVVTLGWWLALWSPAGEDLAAAEARRDGALAQQDELAQQRLRLIDLAEQRPVLTSRLESLRAAVPERADLAEVLLAIDEIAAESGVEVPSVAASEPAASPEASGLATVSLAMSGEGGYFQVIDFINRLNRIHRVMVVESISLTSAAGDELGASLGPPDLAWNLAVSAYVTADAVTEVAVPADPASDAAEPAPDPGPEPEAEPGTEAAAVGGPEGVG